MIPLMDYEDLFKALLTGLLYSVAPLTVYWLVERIMAPQTEQLEAALNERNRSRS